MSSPTNGTSTGAGGGWEKVGGGGNKGKTGKKNASKFSKTEKKKFAETAPRLQDVLSMDQISSAYSESISAAPETESPKQAKGKSNNSGNNKKKPDMNGGAKKPAAAEKPPSSVEEAVKRSPNMANELKSLVETLKTKFPDQTMIWLRDVASYFNSALHATQPLPLQSMAFSDRPLTLLSKETRKTLTLLLESCGVAAREGAFEVLLANMAHEMAKDRPHNGYLVVLQLMSEVYPSLATYNMTRFNELRNSYQNRPAIGTALLWALGQGGRKDLSVGITVWLDFMQPMMALKNYSRFVVEYLSGLFSHHSARIKSSKSKLLYSRQYFLLFDAIFGATGGNLNKDMQAELRRLYPAIKAISVGDCSDSHEVFPEFLRRLHAAAIMEEYKGNSGAAAEALLEALSECVANNPAAVKHWGNMYITYLPASARLLSHLNDNWKKFGKKLHQNSAFAEMTQAFVEHNESASSQKPGMEEANIALQSITSKLSRSGSGGGGGFRWKFNSFLLLCAIAFLVQKDVERHGSFKASNTGVFLHDVGLYKPVLDSYDWGLRAYDRGYKWAEKRNIPTYVDKAKVAAGPYVEKASVAGLSAFEAAKATYFDVLKKIDKRFPTLRESAKLRLIEIGKRLQKLLIWVKATAVNGWNNTSKFVSNVKQGKVTKDDVSKFAERSWKNAVSGTVSAYETARAAGHQAYAYASKQVEALMSK